MRGYQFSELPIAYCQLPIGAQSSVNNKPAARTSISRGAHCRSTEFFYVSLIRSNDLLQIVGISLLIPGTICEKYPCGQLTRHEHPGLLHYWTNKK